MRDFAFGSHYYFYGFAGSADVVDTQYGGSSFECQYVKSGRAVQRFIRTDAKQTSDHGFTRESGKYRAVKQSEKP